MDFERWFKQGYTVPCLKSALQTIAGYACVTLFWALFFYCLLSTQP